MANTNSIFYQIGQKVRNTLNGLLSPYTEVADIQNTTTLGTVNENSQTFGGSTLRIAALDPNVAAPGYVDVTYAVGGGVPVAATFAAGILTITTDGAATVQDVIAFVNDPGNSLTNNFHASLSGGTGTDLITAKTLPFAIGTSVTVRKDLTVSGDLTVKGATTTVETTTLSIEDNIINLSKGASGATYNKDSGLFFERGTGLSPAFFIYDESADKFVLGGETSGTATDDTLDAVASDAGRGTLQVGKVEVWNDDSGSPSWLEIGDLEDFSAGLS